jgi:CRP-like cAMP-binding protein
MKRCDLYIKEQFNFLKSTTLNELDEFIQNSMPLKVKKGDIIFFENEHLKKLFYIHEGACKFSLVDDNGKEHITKLLGKGELMGRRSIITSKGALFTATALVDTTLYSFNKEPILRCMQKNNAFCQDLLKGFIEDMDDEIEKITYFQNYRTLKVRLAGLLLYLSKKFGIEKNGWINVTLKRQDIANILGTVTETCIRNLSILKKEGLITCSGKKMCIIDSNRLENFIYELGTKN